MGAVSESRYTVMAGWDDVPHLDADTKRELLASTPPHLRKARSQGIPALGSGAIYPVDWDDVTCAPFAIPAFWRRAYGLDVGWRRTAAIWLAEDPADKGLYGYAEHYRGDAIPLVHAGAIKARGEWIPGTIDPASKGRSQVDGRQLFETYTSAGLNLTPADNAIDAGIYEVWSRLETGRLKFFTTLQSTASEYRLYRRDERGRIVKENDHLMDALRYAVMMFDAIARVRPPDRATNSGLTVADTHAGY